jgi:hypothetical protein
LDLATPQKDDHKAVNVFALRWMTEVRGHGFTEVQCRNVISREVVESGHEAGMPAHVALAWAHLVTDRVAEYVSILDKQVLGN